MVLRTGLLEKRRWMETALLAEDEKRDAAHESSIITVSRQRP